MATFAAFDSQFKLPLWAQASDHENKHPKPLDELEFKTDQILVFGCEYSLQLFVVEADREEIKTLVSSNPIQNLLEIKKMLINSVLLF